MLPLSCLTDCTITDLLSAVDDRRCCSGLEWVTHTCPTSDACLVRLQTFINVRQSDAKRPAEPVREVTALSDVGWFVVIFCKILLSLAIFGNLCPSLGIFGHLHPSLAIFGAHKKYVCNLMEISEFMTNKCILELIVCLTKKSDNLHIFLKTIN